MAPVIATTTGVPTHTIQDSNLQELLSRLEPYDSSPELNLVPPETGCDEPDSSSSGRQPVHPSDKDHVNGRRRSEKWVVDIEGLVGELERWPQWHFQEQVGF